MDIDSIEEKFYSKDPIGKRKEEVVLAAKDEQELLELFQKEILSVKDMERIEYLLVGKELKLSNLNPLERYRLGKFLIWIQEQITIAKRLKEAMNTEKDKQVVALLENTYKEFVEAFKKMVSLYLFLLRSPLSMNGFLINMLTTNKQMLIQKSEIPNYSVEGGEQQ